MTVALDTLENVKTALAITSSARDDVLEQLIEQVSSYIIETTGCEFRPKVDVAESRTVEYRAGSGVIDLWPFQARTVTNVVFENGLAGEHELAAGAWTLAPIANRYGVYDWIQLDACHHPTRGRIAVSVTGTWGWATIPANVISWLHRIVDQRFRDESAFFADADGTFTERPDTIPFAIREEMERMRRVRIGSV